MKDNGSEIANNGDRKRDSKGRFLPGCRGGGRKKRQPMTLEELEVYLQQDLKSKDAQVRHRAMRLYLVLKKQMVSDEPVPINPELKRLMKNVAREKFSDPEVQEADENELFD